MQAGSVMGGIGGGRFADSFIKAMLQALLWRNWAPEEFVEGLTEHHMRMSSILHLHNVA